MRQGQTLELLVPYRNLCKNLGLWKRPPGIGISIQPADILWVVVVLGFCLLGDFIWNEVPEFGDIELAYLINSGRVGMTCIKNITTMQC
jgi:hypothetical protein